MASWQAGDHIAVDYSITLGDSAANSTFALQLFNVTRSETGPLYTTDSALSITDAWYANATSTGVYAGFSSSWQMLDAAPDVNVDTFTVIPEPATLGLIGFVGSAMLFARRRLSL